MQSLGLAKIKLWAQGEDIANYIERKIAENPRAERLIGKGDYRDMIVFDLTKYARGMFLFIDLQIEHLCKQTIIKEILAEPESLQEASAKERPLDSTYDRAMETLRSQPKNCVKLAFRILSTVVGETREPVPFKAVISEDEEIVQMLLEKGVDPSSRDGDGELVLRRVVIMRNGKLVRLLLEKGADTSAGYRDKTISCEAVVKGNESIVKLLIENGADPFVTALEGVIPLELAQRKGLQVNSLSARNSHA